MERLPQHWEPENFPYGLTEGDYKDGYQIRLYEEGYFKYKIHSDSFEVVAIYVKKEFREQGMGTKFMKDAEEMAKWHKRSKVIVLATTDGQGDILGRFLIKLGYKDSGNYIWFKNI